MEGSFDLSPALPCSQLFRWLVFDLLVANDNCHLKNLFFLVFAGHFERSHHRDLLTTGFWFIAQELLLMRERVGLLCLWP